MENLVRSPGHPGLRRGAPGQGSHLAPKQEEGGGFFTGPRGLRWPRKHTSGEGASSKNILELDDLTLTLKQEDTSSFFSFNCPNIFNMFSSLSLRSGRQRVRERETLTRERGQRAASRPPPAGGGACNPRRRRDRNQTRDLWVPGLLLNH